MDRREQLHYILVDILGSNHVYYDAPESLKMEYPCIRYFKQNIDTRKANNKTYAMFDRYRLTLIDVDPDNPTVKKLLELPTCSYDRHYTAQNLHHDELTIYY